MNRYRCMRLDNVDAGDDIGFWMDAHTPVKAAEDYWRLICCRQVGWHPEAIAVYPVNSDKYVIVDVEIITDPQFHGRLRDGG